MSPMEAIVNPPFRGSLLDADHPQNGVLIPRQFTIERVNQVWCSDVTYIPMAKGFLYLVVVMDWVSRAATGWRPSNTLGADFCVEAAEEALCRYGRPEIFKTHQGSMFTSDDFTGTLKDHQDHHQHGRQGPVHGQHLRRVAAWREASNTRRST